MSNPQEKELREVLEEELNTIFRLVGLIQPKNKEEWMLVALPNLHIRIHELLALTRQSILREVEEAIFPKGVNDKDTDLSSYGWILQTLKKLQDEK